MAILIHRHDEHFEGDDIAVMPSGLWYYLEELENGLGPSPLAYWDDYEMVRKTDVQRLKELGIAEELGLD
jgi:hypothetical protein